MTQLNWLPAFPDWKQRLKALPDDPAAAWDAAVGLANCNINFVQTNALDEALRRVVTATPSQSAGKSVRLAMLGTATLRHLQPAIRVAGLRRGIFVDIYENEYGQYLQELSDKECALYEFKPNYILVSLDAYHLTAGVYSALDEAEVDRLLDETKARIRSLWRLAKENFRCPIIHQTTLPVHLPLLGQNEHRLPGSRVNFVAKLNAAVRMMADEEGVDLLALDAEAARDGIGAWHSPALWHRSKQEIAVAAGPMYGDLVARLIAAKKGLSYKCLVLDLDNTLWGGVVGDDGVEGIVIGQGTALGEAFVQFQDYCRELSRRGVILAVCSKNDEANALEPFDSHPDMVLKRSDISCFVANWSDKAGNIRSIAQRLNIGLDSLVFVDDNPFERNLIRKELPMVAVPEVDDDPANYAGAIAAAGYFEGLYVTDEDRERTGQYRGNAQRDALKESVTDLDSYLRELDMRLVWGRFDKLNMQRIVQLIARSNQFNLTTRRYTEQDILAVIADPNAFGLHLRLIDRFGDNGIIAIIIGRLRDDADLEIDTWLMSCRVLGRQVEPTTLNLIAERAKAMGARRLLGQYIPTKKNGMVKEHYAKLGFTTLLADQETGSRNVLDLASFRPIETFIHVTSA